MKKILILLSATLFFALTANGQNFFFIGEKSYPCTETFELKSNSHNSYVDDLKVIFAKDGARKIVIVSTRTASTVRISGKLIIYLDDGMVITCIDRGNSDNVDDIASSAYQLTDVEVGKLKNSNINTIRYEIKCAECAMSPTEGNYSASNKGNTGTDFSALIAEFYSE